MLRKSEISVCIRQKILHIHTNYLINTHILRSKFKTGIANHNNFLLTHLTITVNEVLHTVTAYWDVTPCTVIPRLTSDPANEFFS